MSMDFTDLFAGVRVSEIADARARYERLIRSEPAFFPNDVEAVSAVGEHRWFYLLQDAPKAGSATVTIMVADLDATAEAIRRRGIEPTARGLRPGAQVHLSRPRRQRDRRRPDPESAPLLTVAINDRLSGNDCPCPQRLRTASY